MKRIIKIFYFITSALLLCAHAFSQKVNVDSMVQKIVSEKDDNRKLKLTIAFYTPEINNDPAYAIEIGLKLLKQSQLDNNVVESSSAYSFLGHGYRLSGSNIRALEYHHKAIALAESTDNFSLLGIAKSQLAHIYKDRGEYDKAIQLYQAASADAGKGMIEAPKVWPLANLGSVYLAANKLDSALMYAQRSYEENLKIKDKNVELLAYLNLGGIHSKMGNGPLALTYYCDETIEYDATGGQETGRATAPANFIVTGPRKSGADVRVRTHLWGSNPLITGVPPIEWMADFTISNHIDQGYIDLTYQLNGKGFPAFETFIEDPKGNKAFIMAYQSPEKGQAAIRLLGSIFQKQISGTIRFFTDSQGNFTGIQQQWGFKAQIKFINSNIINTKAAPDL